MTNAEKYRQKRWEYWRDMMDAPNPKYKGVACKGNHPSDWDWVEWRGNSYNDEKAYCASCGRRMLGHQSPWGKRAAQDWENSQEYKDELSGWFRQRAADKIKGRGAAREKAFAGDGRYGASTWFGDKQSAQTAGWFGKTSG